MTAPAPEPSAAFIRWNRISGSDPSDYVLTYAWSLMTSSAREFWTNVDDALAAAQEPHAAPELAEPVTVAGVLCRDYPSVVAAMQAEMDRRHVLCLSLIDERDQLRELLDEIGVMAANAPEDGDSFGLLEQIAMRIAAADVPDSRPPALRMILAPCPVHTGSAHAQIGDDDEWFCLRDLADTAESARAAELLTPTTTR